MKKLRFLLLFSLIVLVGQGCFGGGATTGNDGGVWRTADAGKEWVQATAVPGPKDIGSFAGQNMNVLVMDPSDPDTMYAGTLESGLFFTTNAGVSWERPRIAALREGKIQDIAIDPNDVCTAYIAKGTRLYKTDDCLRTFDDESYVEARKNTFIRKISVDWFNSQIVWIGLSNGDLIKSEDGGETWRTPLQSRSEITDILISNADSRVMLAASKKHGFYRSEDGGASWANIKDELGEFKNASRVTYLTQDKNGGVMIAATGYGLIRSFNSGQSWEAIELVTEPGQVQIRSLAIAPEDASRIYYSAAGTFYLSVDNGKTWQTQRVPSNRLIQSMVLDPRNPEVLYIALAASTEKKGL